MKNRYLLLLVILIISLTGQSTKAMSQLPLPVRTSIVNQCIPKLFMECQKDPIDRLRQEHWATKSQIILLAQGKLDAFQLEDQLQNKVDPALRSLITKYHPGFKLNWRLAPINWITATESAHDTSIGVPKSFVLSILHNRKSMEDGCALHEAYHTLSKDRLRKEKFYKKNGDKGFCDFAKQTECRADDNVPNDPEILKNMYTYFDRQHRFEEAESRRVNMKVQSPIHPPFAERAARVEVRLNRLNSFDKAKEHFNNQKVHEFFGSDVINSTPVINGTSPRKAAKVLGLCQDYYPNLRTDMFKPTNLARYAFSRNNEFLRPRVVLAIEYKKD